MLIVYLTLTGFVFGWFSAEAACDETLSRVSKCFYPMAVAACWPVLVPALALWAVWKAFRR